MGQIYPKRGPAAWGRTSCWGWGEVAGEPSAFRAASGLLFAQGADGVHGAVLRVRNARAPGPSVYMLFPNVLARVGRNLIIGEILPLLAMQKLSEQKI
jgi:hypothetical protein